MCIRDRYTYLISAGFFSWLFWGIVPNFYGIIGIFSIVIAGTLIIISNSTQNEKFTKLTEIKDK